MTGSVFVMTLSLLLLLLPSAMQAAVDTGGAQNFNLTPDGVKLTDPQTYFDACKKNMGSNTCNSYSCYTR